jgi:hypothetical protein
MKKILLISLVMLLAVSVAFSQFGIKGGLNLGTFGGADKAINPGVFDASLAGLPNIDPTNRSAFTAGISYKIGLIAGLSIQPEALYTQKGAVYEISLPAAFGGGSGKGTFKLDYVDIPILVKFNLPIPLVSPYIEGGVSYSILVSSKFKGESPDGTSEEKSVKDMLGVDVNKNDFSIVVGVGIEILILDINARYVIGQTKIIKDDPTALINPGDKKIYNRGIMLTAGLRF